MANAWQTVEEAALTLGISSRTLHRRIARNEVETRLENGRREVLVEIPDAPPAPVAGTSSLGVSDPYSTNESVMTDVSDMPAQTMLALHEDRIRRTDMALVAYQQSITLAARETRRVRLGARWAWGTAGVALVVLCLGAIWSAHQLAGASAQVNILNGTLNSLSSEAKTNAFEADKFRVQAETARVAAARAEGELEATKNELTQVKAAPQQTAPTITLIDPLKMVTDK
ncbi:MAG TPA: hypothetical protein VL282_10990 [Tepidisphaeraceae bacterium]|nr:hypothetical protein [Tepidisphaeraceae bacterium]